LAKEDDVISAKGVIVDVAAGTRFKVKLDNGHILNAIISGRMRKNNIRIILNDEVDVVISPYDLSVCRITRRYLD
jgi:translation initiation factor IF-1